MTTPIVSLLFSLAPRQRRTVTMHSERESSKPARPRLRSIRSNGTALRRRPAAERSTRPPRSTFLTATHFSQLLTSNSRVESQPEQLESVTFIPIIWVLQMSRLMQVELRSRLWNYYPYGALRVSTNVDGTNSGRKYVTRFADQSNLDY